MASHLIFRHPQGPSDPRRLPAVSHQVPGSDLDMASNDDMLLSAFDLTILPIFGKNMEHSHAEAPGRRQHQYQSGTYYGQWAPGRQPPASVEPRLGDQHSLTLATCDTVDSNGHLTYP
ncbi:hypothetical protein ColTof4_00805 [Colletotrichum tofieldiae]|nr:hypothetical protein ColTof3_08019 [Colletotrichum tofieldiae]GKT68382.1 hypothetical protein ColTof4_00805 [Colletotrichum tofieldiae]